VIGLPLDAIDRIDFNEGGRRTPTWFGRCRGLRRSCPSEFARQQRLHDVAEVRRGRRFVESEMFGLMVGATVDAEQDIHQGEMLA
jgi:hypothetical protein